MATKVIFCLVAGHHLSKSYHRVDRVTTPDYFQFSFSVGMKYSIVDLVVVKDHRTERLARVFDRNRGENHQTKSSATVVARLSLGDMVRVTVTEKYSTVRFPKKASEVIGEDKHITYFTGICLSYI